jgi:hypothetical protein
MKECMWRGEFSEKVKNIHNGHIYLKVLKEQVMSELNLDKPT